MSDDSDSANTNRRSVLKTIGAGALATTLLAGAGSAANLPSTDGNEGNANCDHTETQYRCVDSGCDCSGCSCECDTVRESRDCCVDRYGTVVFCGPWSSTGGCCSSC